MNQTTNSLTTQTAKQGSKQVDDQTINRLIKKPIN